MWNIEPDKQTQNPQHPTPTSKQPKDEIAKQDVRSGFIWFVLIGVASVVGIGAVLPIAVSKLRRRALGYEAIEQTGISWNVQNRNSRRWWLSPNPSEISVSDVSDSSQHSSLAECYDSL